MRKLMLALLVTISNTAWGHEGHDHGPGNVQAPKGGVIRSLETVHLELITQGKEIKIYIYDSKLKAADVSQFPASLTVALPKKKAEALPIVPHGDHWMATFDPKNSRRFDLVMAIRQGGHDDKVKWTVEPKRK
jgi:hypothetical protein